MMVLWQSLGINTYHQWFTIDHQCIAVIVNSKVIRLLAKLQWVFETEHSDKQNPTQGFEASELPKWINSEKELVLKPQPWSVVFLPTNPTQWEPDNNASNFPFALISLLSPGRELLILTTQKSASLTKFLVYPPNLIGPPYQICIGPPTNPTNPKGWGGDRSVNWFKKSEQTWKTMK